MGIRGIISTVPAAGAGAMLACCLIAAPIRGAEGRHDSASLDQMPAEQRIRSALSCIEFGRSLYREGDYLRAAMEFEKVLALDPASEAAREYLKRCEEKLGRE